MIRTFLASFWDTENSFVKRYGCGGYIKTRALHIPVYRIPLSEEKRKSLLAFHAITGCNATSQFCGVGKASAWKVFEDAPDLLKHLGEESQIGADVLAKAEAILYAEYKRWKSTKKEQQRFANPSPDYPHKAGKLSDHTIE